MKSPTFLKKKLNLLALIILSSLFLSLLTVYAYGAFFAHNRYWNGTIKRVQEFDIRLMQNIMSVDIKGAVIDRNITALTGAFRPLEGKIYIEASINGEKIWDNITPGRTRRHNSSMLDEYTGTDKVTFVFDTYYPPSWNSMWVSWIKDVPGWFSSKHDRITIPLLFFMGIWFTSIFAAIWRNKALRERDNLFEVLEDLEELEELEEDEKESK